MMATSRPTARSSSRVKRRLHSRPSSRFCQNVSPSGDSGKWQVVADNRDRFAVRVVLSDRCINGICCRRRREAQVIHNRSRFLRFTKSMERHAFAMAFRGKSVCFALYPPLTTANRARSFCFLHRGDAGQIIGQGSRRRVGEEVKQRQGGKFVTL